MYVCAYVYLYIHKLLSVCVCYKYEDSNILKIDPSSLFLFVNHAHASAFLYFNKPSITNQCQVV